MGIDMESFLKDKENEPSPKDPLKLLPRKTTKEEYETYLVPKMIQNEKKNQ